MPTLEEVAEQPIEQRLGRMSRTADDLAAGFSEDRTYVRNDAGQALAAFRRRRGESLTLLRSLTSEQWQRGCLHPTRGRLTIDVLVAILAWHDDNHLDQPRRALEGES